MISLVFSLFVCYCVSTSGAEMTSDTLVTKEVFMDITIGGQPAGRIILGVFGSTAPKTVTNFVSLADQEASKKLH